MSFFDGNTELKNCYNALPENIKSKIGADNKKIKSAEELNELVRRIKNADSGKIY